MERGTLSYSAWTGLEFSGNAILCICCESGLWLVSLFFGLGG